MYPQVQMTSDTLLRSTLMINETAQSAFLEHSETFSQKLAAAWFVFVVDFLKWLCNSSAFSNLCSKTLTNSANINEIE